ncbi:site-specific integrase [Paenimyroides baculatum]|nr:site-specific integrase [Paenimyroides baculatum]
MSKKTDIPPIHFPKNIPTKANGKLTYKVIIHDYVKNDETSALYLQLFLNGERKRINLDLYIPKSAFDSVNRRVKKSFKGSKDLNLIIEKTISDVVQIEILYRLSDTNLTLDILQNELQNPSSRLDFIKYWEEQIEIDSKHLAASTTRLSKGILAKVKGFKNIILFKDLSINLINELLYFMKSKRGNCQNTIFNITKYLRKYIKRAQMEGISVPIKFCDIPHKKVKAEIGYLNDDEIINLWNFYNSEYITEIYRIILAKFLFSCLTGLRISDIQSLSDLNIIEGFLVKFTAKKTKKIHKIKLSETAKIILDHGFLFKAHYPDQTINRKLKEIAIMCKIPKQIHFHMARHSFATNFLKQNGRVEVLQHLMGHSSIRETMGYVHIVEEDLNEEIFLLDNIFKPKTKEETDN